MEGAFPLGQTETCLGLRELGGRGVEFLGGVDVAHGRENSAGQHGGRFDDGCAMENNGFLVAC